MKKFKRVKLACYILLFFMIGSFTAFADDDEFDPLSPNNPDPGNASMPYISLLVVCGVLYAAYYFKKRLPNSIT